MAKKKSSRRRAADPSRRRNLLDQAAEIMKDKGFGGMSVRDLADTLEFSKANFYYHVHNKEELLYEIFTETLNVTIKQFEAIRQRRTPPPDKLRAIVDVYVHLMTEQRAVMLIWFAEKNNLTAEHHRDVTGLEEQVATTLMEIYQDGVRHGFFRTTDPLPSMRLVFGMCFALTRWPNILDHLSIRDLAAQMQDLVVHGLLAPGRS